MSARPLASSALLSIAVSASAWAAPPADPPTGAPRAMIDLATAAGAAMAQGTWRYSDTSVVEIDFPGPGPEGQPTGASGRTYDIVPHAGAVPLEPVERPRFDFRHVDECQRRSVLERAGAGAGVVGGVQDAVGRDEVGGAAGPEAAEVAGAAVVREVEEHLNVAVLQVFPRTVAHRLLLPPSSVDSPAKSARLLGLCAV